MFTKYLVTANHDCEVWKLHDFLMEVYFASYERVGKQYSARSGKHGCGKGYATPEDAIVGMLLSHGNTNIQSQEIKMTTETQSTKTRVITEAQRDAKNAAARAKRANAQRALDNLAPAIAAAGPVMDALANPLLKLTPAQRVAKIQADAEREHAEKQAKAALKGVSVTPLATGRQVIKDTTKVDAEKARLIAKAKGTSIGAALEAGQRLTAKAVPQTTTVSNKAAAKAERLAEQDKVLAAKGTAAVKAAPAPKAAPAVKTAPGVKQYKTALPPGSKLTGAMAVQHIDPAVQAELRKQGTTNFRVWQLFRNSKTGVVSREDICKAIGLGNWSVSMYLLELKRKYQFQYVAGKESVQGLNAKSFTVPQFAAAPKAAPAAKKPAAAKTQEQPSA